MSASSLNGLIALKLFAPTAFGCGNGGPQVFAKFEKRPDGMMLPGNGRPVSGSLIGVERLGEVAVQERRARHAAEQRAVGRGSKPSYPPKAKNLFLIDGAAEREAGLGLVAGLLPEEVGGC